MKLSASQLWGTILGKPKWATVITFHNNGIYLGVGTFYNSFRKAAADAIGYIEPTSFQADSAVVSITLTDALQKVYDFSKVSGISTAYFVCAIMSPTAAGGGAGLIGAQLYNQTDAAVIVSNEQVNHGANTFYRLTSADIAASLPTASKTLTIRIKGQDNAAASILVALLQAELIIYFG